MASKPKLPEPQPVSFDWHRKLQTSHDQPRRAEVLGDCPISGYKRVSIQGDFEVNSKLSASTTWHYHQDGKPVGGFTPEWLLVEAQS